MKLFKLISISVSIATLAILASASLAKADEAITNDANSMVPVTEEPVHSDAITTESSNADRSPAGWFSEPDSDDSDTIDTADAGTL